MQIQDILTLRSRLERPPIYDLRYPLTQAMLPGTHTFNPNESDDLDMTVFPNLGSHSTYDIGDCDDGKIITAAKASNKFLVYDHNNAAQLQP